MVRPVPAVGQLGGKMGGRVSNPPLQADDLRPLRLVARTKSPSPRPSPVEGQQGSKMGGRVSNPPLQADDLRPVAGAKLPSPRPSPVEGEGVRGLSA